MKKFISFFMTIAIALSLTTAVFAEDVVKIMVDGRTVTFREDAKPTILNDRTYVPVRRVLETMGARVKWNAEDRTVHITSNNNVIELLLTIDSPKIKVTTYTSVLEAEEDTITSDVAPIIINDRTMLPIRVIAEALQATVEFTDEEKLVTITTIKAKKTAEVQYNADTQKDDFKVEEAVSKDIPKLTISSDSKNIKKGDEVIVKVKVSDLSKKYDKCTIGGMTACLYYSTENFEYNDFKLMSKTGEINNTLSANNPNFYENGVKIAAVLTSSNGYEPAKDGTIMEISFTALNDNGGAFALSNGISEIGYDCELVLKKGDEMIDLLKYTELYIDTTSIFVR